MPFVLSTSILLKCYQFDKIGAKGIDKHTHRCIIDSREGNEDGIQERKKGLDREEERA